MTTTRAKSKDVTPVTAARSGRFGRFMVRLAAGLLALVLVLALWLAAGDDADGEGLRDALGTYAVVISDLDGVLTIAPSGGGSDVGVVFLPGTRVQPDAYVATWAPIVEATDISVHIPSVPLNLPVLAPASQFDEIMAKHPTTSTWIVGGHSMGGFEAAAHIAQGGTPAGLLLWGSGPAKTDLTESTVPTLLVSGGSDAILPLDLALREGSLPPDAQIVVIDGMVHGQFGRYSQTEDAQDPARRSDAATLADLVTATTSFMATL